MKITTVPVIIEALGLVKRGTENPRPYQNKGRRTLADFLSADKKSSLVG